MLKLALGNGLLLLLQSTYAVCAWSFVERAFCVLLMRGDRGQGTAHCGFRVDILVCIFRSC